MALEWKRLDNKKSSKISISHQFDGFDKKNWPKIAEWMADIVAKIKNVMQPFLEKYGKEIKSVQFEDTIDNEEDNANELDSLSSQPV